MSKPICFLFGNCQNTGIAHFLAKAGFDYDIRSHMNYQLILGESKVEDVLRDARQCSLMIYQPTPEQKYGEQSSEYYINEVIPKSARTISFAYQWNFAFFPLIGHGDAILGSETIDPAWWKHRKEVLLAAYDAGEIEFSLWPRLLKCAAEQAQRETTCDIATTRFIVNEAQFGDGEPLFINFNHPASKLFVELASQVIFHVTDKLVSIPYSHPNEANLPCSLPLSQYVVDEFDWDDIVADPAAHAHYRELLGLAWENQNRK